MQWLKHAFAIDPPGPAEPTPEQAAAVHTICDEIVRRHMVTPALLFLEMARPLNFVGSQVMHFFNPFVGVFVDTGGYDAFASFLEQRGSIDYICRRLEAAEDDASRPDNPTDSPSSNPATTRDGEG